MAHLYLIAIQQSATKESTIVDQVIDHNEVFDFNSPNITEHDLRTVIRDVSTELHKFMRWCRTLSKDYSLFQEEKSRVDLELEATNKIAFDFS